jgi:lipopolysaccharide/colanic/teichoic acid biosynthesis glycosyltransferase
MPYSKLKHILDFVIASLSLLTLMPIFLIVYVGASLSSKSHGIYKQERIGLCGRPFVIFKFKSMRDVTQNSDYHTAIDNPRITNFGKIIRRTKLDEIPQLLNIIKGEMSFVGPRPDVPGYADRLNQESNYVCKVKPGITCSASLFFRDEELLLRSVLDRQKFNDEVIWPKKVELNNNYAEIYSFKEDLRLIFQTLGIIKSKRFKI